MCENFNIAIQKMGIEDIEFLCQKIYMAGNTNDLHTFNHYITDIKNLKVEAHPWFRGCLIVISPNSP